MTVPIARCHGFTHPFLILVRNTLRPKNNSNLPHRSAFLAIRLARNQRSLTTSSGRWKAVHATKPSESTSIRATQHSFSPLNSKNPVTLYETAPGRVFLLSSYGAAFFCFASAAINSWFNVFNIPPGISSWVPVGFGAVTFAFAVLGTMFALKPGSTIRSIKLLPREGAGTAAARKFEITVRRNAPFPLPYRRFTVKEHEMRLLQHLSSKATNSQPRLTPAQKYHQELERQEQRKAARQYELDHIMTAPFRDAQKASTTIFGSIRRGLTGEGFMPIYIRGVRYKLDLEQGYALDEGRLLDRFVKTESGERMAMFRSKSVAEN